MMTPEERVSMMPLHWLPPPHQGTPDMAAQYKETVKMVKEAIREAVEAEREACALIADLEREEIGHCVTCDCAVCLRPTRISDAIRARGVK